MANKKRPLESLTESEFNTLKESGLLWELYSDAPDTYGGVMEKQKHTPTISNEQIEFMREDLACNMGLSKMIDVVRARLGDQFNAKFEEFKRKERS